MSPPRFSLHDWRDPVLSLQRGADMFMLPGTAQRVCTVRLKAAATDHELSRTPTILAT